MISRTFGGLPPNFSVVELIGIEPTTSSLRTKRSPKLSYSPKYDLTTLWLWTESRLRRFRFVNPAYKRNPEAGDPQIDR